MTRKLEIGRNPLLGWRALNSLAAGEDWPSEGREKSGLRRVVPQAIWMRLLGSVKKTTVLMGSHGKALQPLPGAGLEAQAPCCLSGFFNPRTCVLGATQLYVLDRTASVSGVSGIPCISQCRCKVLGSSVFMCVNMAPALCAILVKISMMPPPAIQ